jgi:hypothetical protein
MAPDISVLYSIYSADIPPHDVFSVEAGRPYKELPEVGGAKNRMELIDNICIARNACLDMMRESLEKYDVAVMIDADEKILIQNSLNLSHTFLLEHPEYAAVALHDGRSAGHTMLGCWTFHRRFFDLGLTFSHEAGGCECADMCKKIIGAGLKVGYLDMKKRLENLGRVA